MTTTCPQCAKRLVEIKMTIQDRNVVMRSCSPCELRWWHAEGDEVGVETIIELASAMRR